MSKDWDEFIPDYVMATGQPPESLFKFITMPKVSVFYASYSMTHATEEVRKIVNEGIDRLRAYGVVIDPQAIEIGLNIPPIMQMMKFLRGGIPKVRDKRPLLERIAYLFEITGDEEQGRYYRRLADDIGRSRN